MYKYPITIELLSETIFGNGQSKNGIVNTDVLLDEEGFPYYLGKTFKGCLKKSINTILKPYCEDKCKFDTIINNLFGINEKGEQNEGKLKFSNFYLDKKITDIFNEFECMEDNKDLILSSLTDIRFGIKMGDNGVSESKSLRASRVLKKGLVFNGFVECKNELKKDEYMILEKGLKSLKNLGVNKSRGKGLVQVKIGKMIQLNSKNSNNVDCNFDYLLYEIDLKQPVKIGDSQSQYDYEQTKSYISGSIVRGAVIGKYLESKGIKSRDTEKDVYFNNLLKKVCFYDAYPVYEEGKEKYYSFPTPNIFRTTKNIDKEDRDTYTNNEFSIVFSDKKVNDEPTVIKLKKGDFSYYRGNTLYQFNIKKDYRFHHSQQKKEENIFRYESISKGQKFYGIVDVSHIDSGLKTEIYKLLKEKEILYLGGSRTSGYGKTEVCNTKTIKDFNELKEVLGYFDCNDIKDKLNIHFLSDSILRDEKHQIVSCFSKEYLNEKFNININENDIDMEISPVILTGYNSTWKSFVPHVYGIEKGSVIKIDLSKTTNKINKNIINEFISSQKGDRKQDGFGRVVINPKFLAPNNIKYKLTNKPCKFERKNSFCSLSDEFISSIKEYRNKVIINKCIKINTINQLKKDNKNNKGSKDNISDSQVNNIIVIINRALLCEKNINPMNEIKEQIKRLNKITQNKERNDKNDKILNDEILLNKSLRDLSNLSEDKIDETVKDILLQGLKEFKCKENIVKKIVENNSEDKFKNERIVLNAARDVFYYSIKAKEGEYVG